MKNPKASVIQMTSTPDVKKNLESVKALIKECSKVSQLVVLPESMPLLGTPNIEQLNIAEEYGFGKIQDFLSEQARVNKIWIVGGTIPIKSNDKKRARAACIVYNSEGEPVFRYDKIHLFDACIEKGVEEYHESKAIEPGNKISDIIETPIGKLGIAICYDIRFPILFQNLLHKGAEIIALPAAFTVKTGKAHWESLAKARCIENFCYGLFSAQTGSHSSQRSTYGHSMIVGPWGEIIAKKEDGIGFVTAEIDLEHLKKVRKNIPVLEHQKIFAIER